MTRNERRIRRHCRRMIALTALCFLAAAILCMVAMLIEPTKAEIARSPSVPSILIASPTDGTLRGDDVPAAGCAAMPEVDPADAEALAKTVWGEARGCSTTEQAAVAWCVLNRLDSGDAYYAGCESVCDIVRQPGQFAGFDPENPVDLDILALCEDVLCRWMMERSGEIDVGRVLPKEYLYFTGDGITNTFTTEWRGGQAYDWSLDSPYEED